MMALFEHLQGLAPTAPARMARLAQRAIVCERMGWTFEEYDQQRAGDILFLIEYWKMIRPGKTEHR